MNQEIQNFEALATTDLRRDALTIAEAGYEAIDVRAAIARNLRIENDTLHIGERTYPIKERRIFFVGVGKCAFAAAGAVEQVLDGRLTGGVALDVSPIEGAMPSIIETYVGSHPLPSEVNESATKHIVEFLSTCREDDLVIMLISGGGSTLLCLHTASMTCFDESTLFQELTARGAPISNINIVRKHISQARGGNLAKAAYPAEVAAFIVSDVPGDDLAVIASGPTVLDTSTVEDARAVLEKYGVVAAANIEFLETPKEQKYFERVQNFLLLSGQHALAAMKEAAEKLGYSALIADDRFDGEARETGRAIVENLHTKPAKTAFLYAGESTVTLPATHGTGGRNEEMALAILADIRDDELVLPFASDGHDNTNYAGAIADAITREHALTKGLSIPEYLDGYRAYDFFTSSGDALVTGYTGSNISDLIIALKK
ncbi:MAG: DUF4147 domain-containing protein [Candidatus Pacebacteria bacterium]|nr:DUF4147 domain-containing protein [Candidatus Paceibacterota bacterium]